MNEPHSILALRSVRNIGTAAHSGGAFGAAQTRTIALVCSSNETACRHLPSLFIRCARAKHSIQPSRIDASVGSGAVFYWMVTFHEIEAQICSADGKIKDRLFVFEFVTTAFRMHWFINVLVVPPELIGINFLWMFECSMRSFASTEPTGCNRYPMHRAPYIWNKVPKKMEIKTSISFIQLIQLRTTSDVLL